MTDTTAADAPSPVELEIQRIRGLMEKGQFAEALPAAESLEIGRAHV